MDPDPALVEALGATDIFGSLDRRALKRVATATTVVRHEPGKELTSQGKDGIAFHLILDGSATVSVRGRTGHTLSKGEYFGEISMIDGEPRSATVTVESALTTAALTSWQFRPLLHEEPAIAEALLLALCRRIRRSESAQPTATD
jgi:CRP/FNR family transcriptional regulator, cyclic AMP receptor protein